MSVPDEGYYKKHISDEIPEYISFCSHIAHIHTSILTIKN
jgi:hypothetical protein